MRRGNGINNFFLRWEEYACSYSGLGPKWGGVDGKNMVINGTCGMMWIAPRSLTLVHSIVCEELGYTAQVAPGAIPQASPQATPQAIPWATP